MLDRSNQIVESLLFGCLACLVMTTAVNADGRVFMLDLRNSSGLQGFRDAEQACASQHARLASAEELHHAVVECFFSSCTRGWLHGGTVGTTVCNTVGSALKAVDVRTENATEDAEHLDAFCVKDHGMPCGDPPSFPNARLQGHTGFELGDELLYTCVPGYVMPSGQSAFSLLCDSCGEWYGLVQICVKDESEVHVDYEDRFTDTHGESEHHEEKPEETQDHMHEEVEGGAYQKEKMSQEQQETGFSVIAEEEHRGPHGEQEVRGEVMNFEKTIEEKNEERAVQDYIGRQTQEQERTEVIRMNAAAVTEAPVSLLSQKHMFWFPSEAFQEEGLPVSHNPLTQSTQKASGAQSQESKEQESQERDPHPVDVDVDEHDHERNRYDDHDTEDQDDHEDSHHDQDDHDSHQDKDDHDDHVKHHIPAQHDDLNRRDSHEKHDADRDDHYDMGKREDDRVRYGSHEYNDRHNTDDKHESYEDHEDMTDHHDDDDDDDDDLEHLHASEEHPDLDDHDDDLDGDDNDHYTDHDDHVDHDSYDDHDSHEHHDDDHRRVIFSIATDQRQNITQKRAGGKATTDETWLDGYPVVPEETEKADSTAERVRLEHRQKGTAVKSTDRPNEVEIRRPAPYTSSPEKPEPLTMEPKLGKGVEEGWAGFIPTAAPSPDRLEPSDSPAYSDTLDYDTQQAAPTHSWMGDLTEHPFLDHGPAPPVHNGDILTGVMEEHTMNSLPGETGERGEMEGERGEAICTGENCPPRPPSSSSRGPKVAAIIVAVFAVAAAVIVGAWCYRRQQQKSSVYEMNGKGQSQSRQGQQIEMQQKV